MRIPDKTWKKFIASLGRMSDKAARLLAGYMDHHRDPDGEWNSPETRKAVIDYASALATKYGEAAAEISCQMYDAAAEVSGKQLPQAEPAETAPYKDVAKAVNGSMKESKRPDVIGSAVGRLVKRTGVDTTLKNAIRDGAEWAWVPSGDTCPFCIMLASRGWQRASAKALKDGHAEHIHNNCDCTYAIRFDGRSSVEGYDPEKYLEMYESADGNTPKERINAMRREQYAGNKDEINAQKREAYAKARDIEIEKQKQAIADAFHYGTTSDEICNEIIKNHKALGLYTPKEMKELIEDSGYDTMPLSRKSASLANVPFEAGGGYRALFKGDGYFQFHPEKGSHHGGAYWKIKNGKVNRRYDLNGDEVNN